VRLVITGFAPSVWVRLEPEGPEEMWALEACVAGGEWTNGRGEEAIATLTTLADRLGYPVGVPERRVPPSLVIVRRGEGSLYARLAAMTREDGAVIWDRRHGERRAAAPTPGGDRRRCDRRGTPPATWGTLHFLIARCQDAPS
jgi:hypothetical protein